MSDKSKNGKQGHQDNDCQQTLLLSIAGQPMVFPKSKLQGVGGLSNNEFEALKKALE